MTTATFATLPDVPACWAWPEPVRPVANYLSTMRDWQAGRCATCGNEPLGGLWEDHDHRTGDTRGFLCPGCNVREAGSKLPVFVRYRQRPPTVILGLLIRYHCREHPEVREARVAWNCAIGEVEELIEDEKRYQVQLRIAQRRGGNPGRWGLHRGFRTLRSVSPLVHAALRGGYRLNELTRRRNGAMVTYPDLIPLARAQVFGLCAAAGVTGRSESPSDGLTVSPPSGEA